MKVYLAALFSRRAEMETYANKITARWVYGGEDGLSRTEIALMDIEDVDKADAIISFTHPRGTMTTGGGRHVEFGYALAKGKKLIVIGAYENVFHHMPNVQIYSDLDSWLYDAVSTEHERS